MKRLGGNKGKEGRAKIRIMALWNSLSESISRKSRQSDIVVVPLWPSIRDQEVDSALASLLGAVELIRLAAVDSDDR